MEESISRFILKWGIPNLPETNKVHIIMAHIPQYILKSGYGLGMCSDEGIESMHQELRRKLEKSKYVVKDKNCENPSETLFRVCICN